MKNLLKKLSAMANQTEVTKESSSSKGKKTNFVPFPRPDNQSEENKPFSALERWFHSVTNKKSSAPLSSSSSKDAERMERSKSTSSGAAEAALLETAVGDFETSISKHPVGNEEYQIQLAMELSAKEDPEAVQIEAVKQISLGSYPSESDPAEVVAYRYWNHNALSYDDKILDGFYDIYGVFNESPSSKMPSLVDLQGMSPSEGISLEVILVNRLADVNLLKLEKRAMVLANNVRSKFLLSVSIELVEELARLVANYMGGPIADQGSISRAWKSLSYSLKSTLGSMVLPLGSLTIGLARHRALLFKVLADSVGIPCQLVKGQQYTGSDEVAMNTVKIDGGREFIVDLMADPGTLIPSDGLGTHVEYEEAIFSPSRLSRDVDSSTAGTSSSGGISSFEESSASEAPNYKSRLNRQPGSGNEDLKPNLQFSDPSKMERERAQEFPSKPSYPLSHFRSPSWTEGVSSPAAQQMQVNDVSQLVIDTAKGNPQFAQKLHDALLESGVSTPPNLFSGIYDTPSQQAQREKNRIKNESKSSEHQEGLPPLPQRGGVYSTEVSKEASYGKNVPFAAAAAAAAAVVASSVVAVVAKSHADSNVVATATAAAVVATAAAVGKQYEHLEACYSPTYANSEGETRSDGLGAHSEGERTSDRSVGSESVRSEVSLDEVADCEIAWEEITVGERIGLGSYGEVYVGDWHGTGVAVKRFLDQDVYGETLEEFKSEVRIMRRLRHPNVVLFMGAVTHPPNLSIVTEFLPRGSLYRLIHRPNNQLDERRRLRMAFDTARGMNYLHNCSPMIVHRDLKSPNLLVDRNWVVKVCDFGLSRIKQSTFLSTRSTAGTAEWMAPEVLRNEPSNEKCDVYSFGVILWELCTLRQPWSGMNPMQVVGAVGFQHRRLDIPEDIDPAIAEIIRKCWETEPRLRPSFAEIMAALKPFQKPTQVSRPSQQTRSRQGAVG